MYCVCVLSISIHHRRTGIMYAMYAARMRAGIAGNYIALALQLLRNFCFSVGSKPASYSRLQARVCECKKMERLLKPLPASHARHCLLPPPQVRARCPPTPTHTHEFEPVARCGFGSGLVPGEGRRGVGGPLGRVSSGLDWSGPDLAHPLRARARKRAPLCGPRSDPWL